MRPPPWTKNYRQLSDAESKKIIFSRGKQKPMETSGQINFLCSYLYHAVLAQK